MQLLSGGLGAGVGLIFPKACLRWGSRLACRPPALIRCVDLAIVSRARGGPDARRGHGFSRRVRLVNGPWRLRWSPLGRDRSSGRDGGAELHPDSFSDGGDHFAVEAAVEAVWRR